MNFTKEQLAEMAGEHAYKRPQIEPLNQIVFNGKDGKFVYKDIIGDRDQDGKIKKVDLGKDLHLVFLKIRRVLFKFRNNEPSLQTSEHNEPNDTVMLFGANEKGIARELRAKYPELRTQQIVYAYSPKRDEVVRLVIKGSSLGSDNKQKGVLGFYEYLASFKKDEHIFEYFTNMTPTLENSKLGEYYAIKFEKGEKLDEATMNKAGEKLSQIHETIKQFDEYYKVSDAQNIVKESKVTVAGTDMEYPEEDITPDDIPF